MTLLAWKRNVPFSVPSDLVLRKNLVSGRWHLEEQSSPTGSSLSSVLLPCQKSPSSTVSIMTKINAKDHHAGIIITNQPALELAI